MATKDIIAAGAVWDDDLLFDDPIGTFKWKVSIGQKIDKTIQAFFTKTKAVGGASDTTDSFNADARCSFVPWELDNGVLGQLVEVACVTHSAGANGSWAIQGQGGVAGSSTGTHPSASIGFSHTFANEPNMATWEFKFLAIPTTHGCPDIQIVDHFSTKNDPHFFWGDSLETGEGSSSVNNHSPQVYISPDCNGIQPHWMMGNKLPLVTENDITDLITDSAREN